MSEILLEAEKHVTQLLTHEISPKLTYHNIEHTRDVVRYAILISEQCQFTVEEQNILLLAAWFHDTGYTLRYENHEDDSIILATNFLKEQQVKQEQIKQVTEAIEATRVPQTPHNKIARVLCDADMFHLSQPDFINKSKKLHNEWTNTHTQKGSKLDFFIKTARFMEQVEYHTKFGKESLLPGKKNNQKLLEKKIKQMRHKKDAELEAYKKKTEKLQQKLIDIRQPQRGIETMFRLTARNQINLSSIADNKANILITVNSLIISIVMTMVVRKISENPHMLIPTLIFLSFCLTSMVFAILSTRPNISSGRFSREDIKQKKVNLLFFGNFYRMELEEYDWAIKEIMKDYNGLYSTMIKDQYYLGKVLGQKYNKLRVAYTIFMYGFIISMLAYVATFIIYPPGA